MEASNVQKIRDALVAIRKALSLDSGMGPHTAFHAEVDRLTTIALSAPARQCDVGTAEEQFKRYLAFCHCESRGCQHCPANETRVHGTSNCDLAWAQMPYEAKEGEGK